MRCRVQAGFEGWPRPPLRCVRERGQCRHSRSRCRLFLTKDQTALSGQMPDAGHVLAMVHSHLMGHASGLRSGETDEYSLVQPVEFERGRLDQRHCLKHVFVRLDLFTATKTGKDLRTAVTHSS